MRAGASRSSVCGVEAYTHDRVPCSSRAQYDMNSGSRPQPQGTNKEAKTTDCIGAACTSVRCDGVNGWTTSARERYTATYVCVQRTMRRRWMAGWMDTPYKSVVRRSACLSVWVNTYAHVCTHSERERRCQSSAQRTKAPTAQPSRWRGGRGKTDRHGSAARECLSVCAHSSIFCVMH